MKPGAEPRGQRIANGEGFYVDILAEIQKQLNFTMEYVPTSGPKEKWGSKMKNGSWNGMVGMLARYLGWMIRFTIHHFEGLTQLSKHAGMRSTCRRSGALRPRCGARRRSS